MKREEGMMFPKPTKKKKKKAINKYSEMHGRDGTCYACLLSGDTAGHFVLHKHHAKHGKPNRQRAEEDGLFVFLCPAHHREVHDNPGGWLMKKIEQDAQDMYEQTHSHEEYIKRYMTE